MIRTIPLRGSACDGIMSYLNPATNLACLLNQTGSAAADATADMYSNVKYGSVPLPVVGTEQPLTPAQINAMTPAQVMNANAQSQIDNSAELTDSAIADAIAAGDYTPDGNSVPLWAWLLGGGVVAFAVFRR